MSGRFLITRCLKPFVLCYQNFSGFLLLLVPVYFGLACRKWFKSRVLQIKSRYTHYYGIQTHTHTHTLGHKHLHIHTCTRTLQHISHFSYQAEKMWLKKKTCISKVALNLPLHCTKEWSLPCRISLENICSHWLNLYEKSLFYVHLCENT